MQRLYILILLLAFSFTIQAQINEVTIGSNPTLQKAAAKEQLRIENILQQMEENSLSAEVRGLDLFIANSVCLLNGDTFNICIDTIGLTQAGASVNICSTVDFGTASQDSTCFQYIANTGITQMEMDSLCIEFCDGSGMCDTTIYPIVVHRSNNTITISSTTLNIEEAIQICPTINLPGTTASSQILSSNSQLGNAYNSSECIFYEAQLFAGVDTIEFEVCDNFCVCDTYLIPFEVVGDTLSLPFMDDFSYDGPYPDKQNWLDKNVFVNNTMAINPVSVGVATFDGLNSSGAPRGGSFGSSDVLTSAYLDLSTGSNVFLSFYIQPQGLGDAPTLADSSGTLILEFKNNLGEWVEIETYNGHNQSNNEFTFDAHPISLSQYKYDGFQFRFRNLSKKTGNIDHWHLDYVRVLENSSPIYPDIAFTQIPNSILKNYTSMPWWQFQSDELQSSDIYSEVQLYNHFDATLEIVPGPGQEHIIEEIISATPVANDQLLDGAQSNVLTGSNTTNSTQVANGYTSMQTGLNNFPNFTYLEFDRTFTYPKLSEEPSTVPAVLRNNTVTRKIIFDNYFSYDDNTAETGIEASKKNTQIAVKFHANVADTLKAVQIHFPHIVVNTATQLFNLKVWIGELDDEPEYVGLLQKPLYIDSFTDSLNGFTTYVLIDAITGERTPLAIPAGDFYIGWQQVSDCAIFECIAIGNDKNNPSGMENVFVDGTGGGVWDPVLNLNPSLEGSLMIRAVVGAGEPQQSSNTEDLVNQSRFSIFPNPSNGLINIKITDGEYHQFSYAVFNAVGQMMQEGQLVPQIDLNKLQNGIYFVKLLNNKSNQVVNHKVIIAK